MTWVFFALGAAFCWGFYGPFTQLGQMQLGNPLKALLCIGMAYFLVGVLFPSAVLTTQGQMGGFNLGGSTMATFAGTVGALGAICIIYAMKSGGVPAVVMPIVFGGAPIVNTLVAMTLHPPKESINPLMYVGILVTIAGASMVLYFRPAH